MALNEAAAIVPAGGYLLHAPVGTPSPENWQTANLLAEPSELTGWESMGHTSLEDLPEYGQDGGENTNLGSWQMKVLRQQQTEVSIDYLVFQAYQFDRTILQMYWGLGEVSPGRFDITEVGANKVERAFMMVITDGGNRVGFWAPRASFSREDSLSLSVEAYAQWPIRATWLQHESQPLMSWLGEEIQPEGEPMAQDAEFAG